MKAILALFLFIWATVGYGSDDGLPEGSWGFSNSAHTPGKQKIRCGAPMMGLHSRPCRNNDTDCGVWSNHFWHPHGCYFRNVTSADARKCLGDRTLAFVGDSMIRDIGFAVYALLAGNDSIQNAPTHKYDKGDRHPLIPSLAGGLALLHGSRIPDFPHWKANVPGPNYNGFVFPKQPNSEQWQVQIWNLFRNEFQHGGQVEDVIANRLAGKYDKPPPDTLPVHNDVGGTRSSPDPMSVGNTASEIRPIDFAFLQHALHDAGWWWDRPFGEKLYQTILRKWRLELYPMGTTPGGYTEDVGEVTPAGKQGGAGTRKATPSTWVSMNPNVAEKVSAFLTKDGGQYQADMVEEASAYLNKRLLHESLPYWDAGAVLRSHVRAHLSADGVHVKMFVDVMRAKMLFNHLCDDDMNWRGAPDVFM